MKMRELRALGKVKLLLVPTVDMRADMLTKPLDDRTFHKHRSEVINLPAEAGKRATHNQVAGATD